MPDDLAVDHIDDVGSFAVFCRTARKKCRNLVEIELGLYYYRTSMEQERLRKNV